MNATALTTEVLRSFLQPEPAGDHPASPIRALTAVGPPIPLPPPAPAAVPGAGLAGTLRTRRAVRAFADSDLDLPSLLATLAAGLDSDRARFAREAGCCPLTPLLVAQRVAGLPLAVYRLDPGWFTATPVMALPDRAACEKLTLQREFARAGAIVSLFGDLDLAHTHHGGPGYRTLMTRAGAAGYQIWLDAVSRGLAGSVFAGFLPAAIRAPLGCDGVGRHQLFAIALGHSAGRRPAGSDRAVTAPIDRENLERR